MSGMNEIANPELSSNLAKARKFLEPFTVRLVPHFIAGERVGSASGATFETLDPTNNATMCRVAAGEAAEIDLAARAAASAFKVGSGANCEVGSYWLTQRYNESRPACWELTSSSRAAISIGRSLFSACVGISG